MATIAQAAKAFERILVVRLGAMGDVIHAMPAVAAIREALPEAHLGWIIEERWAELLCGSGSEVTATTRDGRPLVDVVQGVNTRAWRSAILSDETWAEIRKVSSSVRQQRYRFAIDFQGAIKSALIAQRSGADTRIGFQNPRERIATLFYTRQVPTTSAHVICQNMELASTLVGRSLPLGDFEVARDLSAEAWCDSELRKRQLHDFAILNPGAGWGAKCWPADSYAAVARGLAALGIRSLINYGPSEEQLADAVVSGSADSAQKILCSISELVALTRRAKLLIGGDTGPLHLAAALRVPVVALFGPTDPARNGPHGTRASVLRSEQSTTSYKHHGRQDEALATISAEQVLTAAKELLRIG